MFITSYAQARQRGPQGPPPIPDKEHIEAMVTDLSAELSLTDGQQEQISRLSIAHFEEVKAVQDKYKNSREAEHKEMKESNTRFEKEVKSLLSEEQQSQFDEFRKKHDPRKGGPERPHN